MANFEKYIDLFDSYLMESMSQDEIQDFEKRIAEDRDFNQSFEEYKLLIKGVEAEAYKKLRQDTLDHIRKNRNSKLITMNTNNRPSGNRRFLMIAASLVLLAGAFYFFNSSKSTLDVDKVFADNYTSESNFVGSALDRIASSGFAAESDSSQYNGLSPEEIEAMRLAEMARVDTLSMGLKNFKKSKWLDAKKMLYKYTSRYAEPVEDYNIALYHYAKSCMNNGDYKVAVEAFDGFIGNSSEKEIKQEAEYEVALCNLHINTIDAKKQLDLIAGDNGHKHQDSAKGLLTIL